MTTGTSGDQGASEPPQPTQLQQGRRLAGGDKSASKDSRGNPASEPVRDNGGREHDAEGQQPRPSEKDTGDAQRQLSQYRQNLAWELEVRDMSSRGTMPAAPGPARVSPIMEETSSPPSPPQNTDSEDEPTTASTESAKTVRGGMTPGFMPKTPSYPFPRMTSAASPGLVHPSMHRPFTTLSPTTAPSGHQPALAPFDSTKGNDQILSDPSTPTSAMTFMPRGYSSSAPPMSDFPTPNLYDLALMLSAEPGLDAWWNTVVQIMTELYQAERVTLAVPADSTDIENVPWGQKATFNMHQEDGMSLGYMARGSSMVLSSKGDVAESVSQSGDAVRQRIQSRPELQSRHSYTSYEEQERLAATERPTAALRRPNLPSRSKTSHPTFTHAESGDEDAAIALNRQALEEHDALDVQQEIPSWEAPMTSKRPGQGKVLNVLQALNYEADPLIDHNGVHRVLERGRVVALTRTYPYLGSTAAEGKASGSKSANSNSQPEGSRRRPRKARSDSTSKLSSLLGSAKLAPGAGRTSSGQSSGIGSRIEDDHPPRPPTPKYEEYEQTPPSPWSQSPAPSPAVRPDPSENPFFTDAMVDEETFNPTPVPPDYTDARPLEAIGVDDSWTVLHVPLTHVFLSKPNPAFKLDSTIMEQKMSARNRVGGAAQAATPTHDNASTEKHAPIAILSILSPIIPYPSNLLHSLEHLAPHLATSYSLCRHYSNLETELNGLKKRRPGTAGFGAMGPDGRLLADPSALTSLGYLPSEDNASRGSLAGSITSPSDYSGPSRSAAASPTGTPSWDPHGLGYMIAKRTPASSPAPIAGDGYFSTKANSTGGGASQRPRRNSRDSSNADKRSSLRLSGKAQWQEAAASSPSEQQQPGSESGSRTAEGSPTSAGQHASRRHSREQKEYSPTQAEDKGVSSAVPAGSPEAQKKQVAGVTTTQHRHTQLHSYGADFASTFQSLPPSATIVKPGAHPPVPSRTGSVSQTEMTPPSDKLKGLILDSLPAHVFVALPQTGEIVWVNSRFLTYRGQTSGDLAADPWGSIHPDDREEYLRTWSHSVRTGEQFSRTVRIRRFDGAYRWFYARAVASKDKRGVIMQFLGSYMDIHDQHIAEVRAARQEEIEASEAKHRLLANLIPQIIFTATEDEGITFANEQWLSYTGQAFEDVLGLGFMDYVHPDDIAKCQIPTNSRPGTPLPASDLKGHDRSGSFGRPSFGTSLSATRPSPSDVGVRVNHPALSRNNSSGSSSVNDLPNPNLTELARLGVIKVSTDSNGRLSYTTEIRLRSKTGEYRWHLIRCVEIDNVDFGNGASSYFGSATDINDLKLLETKLKEAMESKGRFLSNMSHEIRTPLIGISGMVSFLQDTTLTEEQRDYTNTIQTSANSLIMIINDILDLSKVDAGMMKLNYEWFHTRSLIEDVNELVSTMAIAKRLELNYVVEEDVPAWVKGDKVRIRQVLLNVIGNAIKFTSEGEVFSRCKVVVQEEPSMYEDEIMLEFSIIDTGRGFTKEEAELIFKPFSQIDGSSTRQHGGSGLGLVISRQLVELHGGEMEGTAIPGKGSTFTFTAKFGLPKDGDSPELAPAPQPTPMLSEGPLTQTPSPFVRPSPAANAAGSPPTDVGSPAGASTGSSVPSLHSTTATEASARSSMSSVNAGLARFSEAARASGQDLSQMKFEMPPSSRSPHKGSNKSSSGTTPTPGKEAAANQYNELRPPMYSILVICPQTLSREATTKHIEMTLPKDIPHQITALGSVEEAKALIGGEEPVVFTHVVVNLPTPEEIISLMDEIMHSKMADSATIVILSDSVQRQAVLKQVADTKYQEVLSEEKVTYIYKPVKPSRFAVIFDPAKERDFSIDRNRSTAQRLVEDQKASYLEMEKKLGNKGHKVLLVEDNPVNQKVLQKYLKKVGVAVELVVDGVECTEAVFSKDHGYYSLILCDLHMPRKDGYQACREIREWEAQRGFTRMPIIALSANVMSDVQEKCIEAGFSDYVTKPVDFINLSKALSRFF
ncbi:hypothetical protein QBC37DRAFT_185107 [Rhypophila decipiens]|uniref:histidine kinase n=1 Tax=Rhypophila decipiens TaxID=261697 RepID=A0AAN6Y7Q9_9PEZI|nr:hypothetical protein QBC37DRAFT_185107 [Rhypophila decipiens]